MLLINSTSFVHAGLIIFQSLSVIQMCGFLVNFFSKYSVIFCESSLQLAVELDYCNFLIRLSGTLKRAVLNQTGQLPVH